MRRIRSFLALFGAWLIVFSAGADETTNPKRLEQLVVVLSSDTTNPFWWLLHRLAEKAAHDLGVRLEILQALQGTSRSLHNEFGKKVKEIDPHFLIFKPNSLMVRRVFSLVKPLNTQLVSMNIHMPETIGGEDARHFKNSKSYFGGLYPNEKETSRELISTLFHKLKREQKLKKSASKQSSALVVYLGGTADDSVSLVRLSGIKDFVEEKDSVSLAMPVFTNWSSEEAQAQAPHVARRYPEANVMVSITGELGRFLSGRYRARKKPVPYVEGAFNWTEENLVRLQRGSIDLLAGGHFVEGACLITGLFNWHRYGVSPQFRKKEAKSAMSLIEASEATEVLGELYKDRFRNWNFVRLAEHLRDASQPWVCSYKAVRDIVTQKVHSGQKPFSPSIPH